MGKEIVMTVSGSYWYCLPLVFGIFALLVAFTLWLLRKAEKIKAALILSCLFGGVVLCLLAISLNNIYDAPAYRANEKVTLEKLQTIQKAYQQPFYLKEMVSESGIRGELKGDISGFLFVSGSIYGRIDSRRVITVIYGDNDPFIDPSVNVHRSIFFSLEEVVIATIPKGERPYLMYPEAKIFITKIESVSKLELTPGTPYLYLPEGWKIL